jgi:hypothetical protein
MRYRFLSLGALAVMVCAVAQGRECSGVSFSEQLQSEAGPLVLNGLGMRQATVFKVDVYVGALYLTKPSTDAKAILDSGSPYAVVMQFVRNVGAKDIAKGWSEGFDRNDHDQLPALSARIATLTSWMSDIKTGQRLQFVSKPGAGLEVNVNGTVKGLISGADFARAFLSIWLATPSNPEIKVGMLGGHCN